MYERALQALVKLSRSPWGEARYYPEAMVFSGGQHMMLFKESLIASNTNPNMC